MSNDMRGGIGIYFSTSSSAVASPVSGFSVSLWPQAKPLPKP
jgi:hypothetical protein